MDKDEIESLTCDKCREVVSEHDLIWITAEGFTPLDDEVVNPDALGNMTLFATTVTAI